MNKTKAVIYDALDSIKVGEVTLPECNPDQLIAETLYTFVSPGTELRVLGGHYGAAGKYPMVPGYSAVSRVVSCGSEVKGFRVGDYISCRNSVNFADCRAMWGGQAGMHVYDTDSENTPVLLPEGVEDYLPYSVAEVAAISLRGVESAYPTQEDTAVVIGQGMIGQFSALFLRMYGCKVVVCDIDANRLEEAKKAGDNQVWMVKGQEVFAGFGGGSCLVDGAHPNDLGFYAMAKAIAPVLREALESRE